MSAKAKPKRAYGLAEAKARLSEVVARAQAEGPQPISYRGKTAAYVVSAKEWEDLQAPRGTLLEWLRETGILGLGVDLELPPDPPIRDIQW